MQDRVKCSEKSQWKAMNENYGYSFYYANSYLAPWLRRSPLHYGAWLIMSMYNTFSVSSWMFILCKSVILRPRNFQILTECTHMIILLILLLSGVFNTKYRKAELERILRAVGEDIYKYGDTLDEETAEVLKQIKEKTFQQKQSLSKVVNIIIISVTVAHTTLRPLADLFTSDRIYQPDEPDGITHVLSMDVYYPMKLYNSVPAIILAYTHLLLIFFWGGNVVVSAAVTFICYSHTLCGEYRILCVTTRRLVERAKAMFHRENPDKPFISFKNDIIFERCLRRALKDSVKHQQKLTQFADDIKVLYYYVILTGLLCITALLCFGGIVFTVKDPPIATLALYIMFLSGELYLLLLFCVYGGMIRDLSMQVGQKVYFSDWTEYVSMIKTDLLIMQTSSQMPRGISAGGFHYIEFSTFSDVTSSAFSYFNIVNAVRKD
ncbi:uncharacterized protein isoform X1 [Rhodnius prolixus]|uniref:uncharacterized protein isoform X1 n=1 Tax=Rhodnius prolixus TaxID=13249 RepID=UPI003D18F0B8